MGAGAQAPALFLHRPPLNAAEPRCQQDGADGIMLWQHMCGAGLVLNALEL